LRRSAWLVARVVAVVVALIGGIAGSFSAVELYLVLNGDVKPGQPIYVDALAPTAAQSATTLVICVVAMALAFALSRLAQSRLREGPNSSFKPTPSARLN
jgi:hypothetical protein